MEFHICSKVFIYTLIIILLQIYNFAHADSTTAIEAELVVRGWLKVEPQPMDITSGKEVLSTETYFNGYGESLYYIVNLNPNGFVIVSTDDLIEPVIGFSDDGFYEPAQGNPLFALLNHDLNQRLNAIKDNSTSEVEIELSTITPTQQKWDYLTNLATTSEEESVLLMSSDPICDNSLSDIRVAPLLQSRWGQTVCYGSSYQLVSCFNYYTPQMAIDGTISFEDGQKDNYPSGCIGTSMAQIMRYHSYPVEPIEPQNHIIYVYDLETIRSLRGGSVDGAYNWNNMVFEPGRNTTLQQRQAIGALCHDAGVSISTIYTAEGSGGFMENVPQAMMNTFQYANSVCGYYYDNNGFMQMVNPNLDANCPVLIGIGSTESSTQGHAVVCDGYGYNSSTLYHHLNMGWNGIYNCWYNIPNISCTEENNYDLIYSCTYNIFPDSTGEIISGRVFDEQNNPIPGVEITAISQDDIIYTTMTNSNGIYAFRGVESDTNYTVTAKKNGYDFNQNEIRTGISLNGIVETGNRWGVDFTYFIDGPVFIGSGNSSWEYPIHTAVHDSRTQTIYHANEIGRSGYITSLSLDIKQIPEQTVNNWTIRMKHTGIEEYNTVFMDADGWTVVYQNNEDILIPGWNEFEFETPFEYNGIDNLIVDFSYNNSINSQNAICYSTTTNQIRSVYSLSNSQHGNPLDWALINTPIIFSSNRIPNLQLMISSESNTTSENVRLIASDSHPEDYFGCSVSLDGDYAIIGAYKENSNRGTAYIFKLEGTKWIQQDKIFDVSGDPEDYFGYSVSISGDYAFIGAGDESGYETKVYIFKRENQNWTMQECFYNEYDYGFYGYSQPGYIAPSVSVYNNYAIAGMKLAEPGEAYIYYNNGINWNIQSILTISSSTLLAEPREMYWDFFGSSVSINENYAVVAAVIDEESGQNTDSGSVYVFKRDGTNWIQHSKLTTSESPLGKTFGQSVSISGDTVLVGESKDSDNGHQSGSAYIFKLNVDEWIEQAKLLPSGGQPNDLFGSSVCIKGSYAIIGAPGATSESQIENCGKAYIFKYDGTEWIQHSELKAMDIGSGDRFGSSVSISESFTIVGSPNNDDAGKNSGSACIFPILQQ